MMKEGEKKTGREQTVLNRMRRKEKREEEGEVEKEGGGERR